MSAVFKRWKVNMEKDNFLRILIGLCVVVVAAAIAGLIKMDQTLQKKELDNADLRKQLILTSQRLEEMGQTSKAVPDKLDKIVRQTQKALERIEYQREAQNNIVRIHKAPAVTESSRQWVEELKKEMISLGLQEKELIDVITQQSKEIIPESGEIDFIEQQYEEIAGFDQMQMDTAHEIKVLKDKVIDKEQEYEQIRSAYNDMAAAKQELEKQVRILSEEKNKSGSGQGHELTGRTAYDKKLAGFSEKIKELEGTRAELRGTIAELKEDNKRLQKLAESTENTQIKLLKEQIRGVTCELDAAIRDKKQLAQKFDQLNEQFSQLRLAKEKKSIEMGRLHKEMVDLERDSIDRQYAEGSADSAEKLEQVTLLYSRLKRQLEEVAAILAGRDSLIEQRESELLSLTREKEYLQQKVQYLEKFFSSFKQQQETALQKLSDMDSSLADERKQVDVILNSSVLQK